MKISQPHWPGEKLFICLVIDQFSAQAIAALQPEYSKKSFVVVQQDAESHKSVVWSCSLEAKRLKIKPGIPVRQIKKKQPRLHIVKRDQSLERAVRRELELVFVRYTPHYDIRDSGICILDLTHTPIKAKLTVHELADNLRRDVFKNINLEEIALGISQSKLLARVMAGLAGPDGKKICMPGDEQNILNFLETRFLPHLSPPCRKKLRKYGLKKIGQIRQIGKADLLKRFGQEGEKMYLMARGLDYDSSLSAIPPMQAEAVLQKDINHIPTLKRYLHHVADKLCYVLKTRQLQTDRVTVVIKYTDAKMAQKTGKLGKYTSDFLLIYNEICRLFNEIYQRRVAIKSIKTVAKNPKPDSRQLSLYESTEQRRKRLFWDSITKVREGHHFNTLLSAGELGITVANKIKQVNHNPKYTHPGKDVPPAVKNIPFPDKTAGEIHIGTTTPGDLAELGKYQKHFSFTEITGTFYQEPRIEDFLQMERKSKESMLFSVKLHHQAAQPKKISIPTGEEWMNRFLSAVAPLVETGRFYGFLLQLGRLEYRSQEMLNYLLHVSARVVRLRLDIHIEFSHPSWLNRFVLQSLKDNGIGICNSDFCPGRHHTYATTEKGYLRYNGRGDSAAESKGKGPAGGEQPFKAHQTRYLYSDGEIRGHVAAQIQLKQKVNSMAVVYANLPPLSAKRNALQNMNLWPRPSSP